MRLGFEHHVRRGALVEPVLIGKRQQNQVTGFDLAPGAARRLDHAIALGHEVEDADMAADAPSACVRRSVWARRFRNGAVRRALRKTRAGQANRAQAFSDKASGSGGAAMVGRRFGIRRRLSRSLSETRSTDNIPPTHRATLLAITIP